ncbi:MAG: PorP/SprF family type IX secretion system membrane protein [Prevotellaceae bacterium]|jgi:type IX secretion system PorP/SprF family membrane protein|nr:PorP/SprF family type IX secretion system membrane protein [Prevotellaceae bacterium]
MHILDRINLTKRFKLLLLIVFIYSNTIKAQDAIFSLFESTAMNFNPSHVGNEEYSRVTIGYRNQYPTYKSPFATYTAAYDLYLENIHSGFGLMVMHDDVGKGVFATTSLSLAYSNNIRLAEDLYIRGGLSLSYINRKRDPSGLIFPDMPYFNGGIAYPSDYLVIKNNTIYVGFGATVLFKRFKAGAAVFNLGGQNLSKSTVISLPNPLKITGYMAYDIPVIRRYNSRAIREDALVISPYVRYIRQYDFDDIDIGAYADFNTVFVGLSHRSDTGFKNSTFVIAAGFRAKYFNIGYSANFGNIGNGARYVSAHEISVIFKLKNRKGEYILQGIYSDREPTDYQRSRTYKCPY